METARYVDVNVFVYWLGKHPKFGETAHEWVKKIESSTRKEYVTSSQTLYETLVVMAGLAGRSLKDKAFVNQVVSSLLRMRGLTIEPLESEDLARAADLMGDYQIDYEDALHLAVAKRVNSHEIISNDKDFDAVNIKRTF